MIWCASGMICIYSTCGLDVCTWLTYLNCVINIHLYVLFTCYVCDSLSGFFDTESEVAQSGFELTIFSRGWSWSFDSLSPPLKPPHQTSPSVSEMRVSHCEAQVVCFSFLHLWVAIARNPGNSQLPDMPLDFPLPPTAWESFSYSCWCLNVEHLSASSWGTFSVYILLLYSFIYWWFLNVYDLFFHLFSVWLFKPKFSSFPVIRQSFFPVFWSPPPLHP